MKHPVALALLAPLALAALAPTRQARAQRAATDTAKLEAVVVTGTRDSVDQAAPTAATTVITGASLRAQGIVTMQQALSVVSSITTVQAGSFGATTSLYLRGGQSNYTLLIVDGAPVNDPGGFLDLANLTTDDVDRIEVVRGPESVLYGPNAISGVIQVFTRRSPSGTFGTVAASGGSFGTRAYQLGFGSGKEDAGITLDLSRYRTNGTLPFNNSATNDVMSGLVRFGRPGASHVTLSARRMNADYHFPTDFTGFVVDSNQQTAGKLTVGSLDAGTYLGRKLELRLLATGTENRSTSQNLPDNALDTAAFYYVDPSTVRQWSVDARFALHLSPSTALTAGGTYDDASIANSDSSWSTGFVDTSSFDHSRNNTAYYANATGDIGDHFTYNVGARITQSDQFGRFTSYRLAGGYVLTPTTSVRGSVGTGFREPSFFEQYSTGFSVGDSALKPEKGSAWEIGLAQSFSKGAGTLGFSYFSQRFTNMIQYDPSVPPGTPNYENIAEAIATGVEVDFHAKLSPAWALDAAYTWLRTNVVDAGVAGGPGSTLVTGEPLLRRPANAGNAGLSYHVPKKLALWGQLVFVGSRSDLEYTATTTSRVTLPSYLLLNVSALITIKSDDEGRYLALTLRGTNVTNRGYEQTAGYAAPGRAIFIGMRLGVEQ